MKTWSSNFAPGEMVEFKLGGDMPCMGQVRSVVVGMCGEVGYWIEYVGTDPEPHEIYRGENEVALYVQPKL